MRPMETTFSLVRPGGAFNKLYALAKRTGKPLVSGTLNFPTVAAERDGRVIGFLSTLPVEGLIVAGPLVLEKAPNMLLAIRLGEAYEVVLRAAGVTTYHHSVEKDRLEYISMLERLGYAKVEETETQAVMRKDLQ